MAKTVRYVSTSSGVKAAAGKTVKKAETPTR